jgi:uncharacterized protein YjbJ (UPF0337 family)
MGIPNSDEVKGEYEAAMGAAKEKVGHVIDDKRDGTPGRQTRSR